MEEQCLLFDESGFIDDHIEDYALVIGADEAGRGPLPSAHLRWRFHAISLSRY